MKSATENLAIDLAQQAKYSDAEFTGLSTPALW
jgi:hypothetical protein